MSDVQMTAPEPQQVPVDTTKDNTPNPVERSTPKEEAPPEVKKPDLDTAIKNAFERSKADKEAKEAAKPKVDDPKEQPKIEDKAETPEAKAARERAPDGKFAPKEPKEPSAPVVAESADGSEQNGEAKAKPSEGRDYTKPPAHFLPRAIEKWENVPHVVKEEIYRVQAEAEKRESEYKESHENWSKLREFDTMAKQANTTIYDSLRNYVAIDQQLRTEPENGIERVLKAIGLTPMQYAQHIMGKEQQRQQNPQAAQNNELQQTMQQMAQELHQLRQRDQEREEQARLNEVAQKFIAPFKAEPGHERYDELEPHIAKILNSGMIPSNLSEQQKLEEAYWMADRLYASSIQSPRTMSAPASSRPLVDPAGQKSITGSPTPGLATTRAPGKEDAKDLDAILRRSLAKATAR